MKPILWACGMAFAAGISFAAGIVMYIASHDPECTAFMAVATLQACISAANLYQVWTARQ